MVMAKDDVLSKATHWIATKYLKQYVDCIIRNRLRYNMVIKEEYNTTILEVFTCNNIKLVTIVYNSDMDKVFANGICVGGQPNLTIKFLSEVGCMDNTLLMEEFSCSDSVFDINKGKLRVIANNNVVAELPGRFEVGRATKYIRDSNSFVVTRFKDDYVFIAFRNLNGEYYHGISTGWCYYNIERKFLLCYKDGELTGGDDTNVEEFIKNKFGVAHGTAILDSTNVNADSVVYDVCAPVREDNVVSETESSLSKSILDYTIKEALSLLPQSKKTGVIMDDIKSAVVYLLEIYK